VQTYKPKLLAIVVLLTLEACTQVPVKVPASEAPSLTQPAPNVPIACASFVGGWEGTWAQGGIGTLRLWVTEVSQDCVATYAYGSGGLPTRFKTAKIEGDSLAIPCGVGGTCTFKRSGEELYASYSSTSGQNSAVFKRLSIEGK
jgi:hypothetical protein